MCSESIKILRWEMETDEMKNTTKNSSTNKGYSVMFILEQFLTNILHSK